MAKIMLTILYLCRDSLHSVSCVLCVACCMGDRSCLGWVLGLLCFVCCVLCVVFCVLVCCVLCVVCCVLFVVC